MSGGILLNHDSEIWLPCANKASRLRPSTGRMSTVVVMRCSDASACRCRSESMSSKSGTSAPSSRSASHIFRQSLPRIALR